MGWGLQFLLLQTLDRICNLTPGQGQGHLRSTEHFYGGGKTLQMRCLDLICNIPRFSRHYICDVMSHLRGSYLQNPGWIATSVAEQKVEISNLVTFYHVFERLIPLEAILGGKFHTNMIVYGF